MLAPLIARVQRWIVLLAATAAGCATIHAPVSSAASPDFWASILRDDVDGLGRVDFARLAANPAALDATVSRIAQTAPENAPALFPARADQLAFQINSYNALAMAGVVRSGTPVKLGLLGRISFFVLTKFVVGEHKTSLYSYENDVIRPMGEERVHFALNCMAVSCPRLPHSPFTAVGLDQQLDAAARQFLAEPRNVTVDDGARVVFLSSIFEFYSEDFLKKAPSLTAYVNHYRAHPIPEDYRVRFFDYDWTINRQPGQR
jgi:hypothetical protein